MPRGVEVSIRFLFLFFGAVRAPCWLAVTCAWVCDGLPTLGAAGVEHVLVWGEGQVCIVYRLRRRLQEELAAMTASLRATTESYEESCRDVENMKRQLQIYVLEVERFEQLLGEKV